MKLGQKVCFSCYWVKNTAGVDPFEHTDASEFDYSKLIPIDAQSMTGIVVGKRRFGTLSHLVWHEDKAFQFGLRDGPDGSGWHCYKTTTEPFYLVACDMVRFYKVKESDLREVHE